MSRTTSRRWRGPCVALLGALAAAGCGGAPARPTAPVASTAPAEDARPAVAPLAEVRFPTPTVHAVGDLAAKRGVELIVVERRASPAVHFRWVIPGGKALEFGNDGRNRSRFPAGTMELLAEMLLEGTTAHPGDSFAAALERHGATLEITAASDAIIVSGRALSHQLPAVLALIAEVFDAPSLDAGVLATRKRQTIAALQAQAQEPRAVAARLLNRVVFGGAHPYGDPGMTTASVARMDRRHLVEAHRAAFAAGGTHLIVVGDVAGAELAQHVQTAFAGALSRSPEPVGAIAAPVAEPPACHVYGIDGAVQSVIVLGNPAVARTAPQWPALVVTNQILGGSASSRLFRVLRERKGLTYGIYSALDGRGRAGDWSLSASVRTEKTDEALAAIDAELALLRTTTPSEPELTAARRFLVGQFVLQAAEPTTVAARLAAVRLYGLPETVWDRYAGAIDATTADDVRALAEAHVGTAARHTVVVGDLRRLRPALDGRCPRIDLRDADGELVRTLVGPDAAMTDADREALFALWAGDAAAAPAVRRYVEDVTRAAAFRAALLDRLAGGALADQAVAVGGGAADWAGLAAAWLDRLLPRLRAADPVAAAAAKARILDLAAPLQGASALTVEQRTAALQAVAAWAFAGVGVDTAPETVRLLVEPRLQASDLGRLGAPAIDGLEALISADVHRAEAAAALIALGDGAATRALVRAYRRVLVVRRLAPTPADLAILARVPDVQTALLLLDAHALLELRESERGGDASPSHAPEARRTTMQTLRGVIEAMAAARARDAAGAQRSVLDRDMHHLQAHLEALLGFRDAGDRLWAATLLLRFRGAEGLPVVLQGLADDDHYADPRWGGGEAASALLTLALDEVAPLGVGVARPQLLAALAGRRRIAKVLAIMTMRIWGDDGSLTALRTHVDATDVAGVLGLERPTSVTELARAAVDANRLLRQDAAEVERGAMTAGVASRRRRLILELVHLTGAALEAEVARRAGPAASPASGSPAPPSPRGE